MDALNEYEIEAIRYAMSRGSVTTKTLAKQIRKSSSLCAKTLKELAEKRVLEWHGSSKNDPSQHYTLAEERSKFGTGGH